MSNVIGFFSNWNELEHYPRGESEKLFLLKNIKIEFSVIKKIALGFMFSPLGEYKVQGYDYIKNYYMLMHFTQVPTIFCVIFLILTTTCCYCLSHMHRQKLLFG